MTVSILVATRQREMGGVEQGTSKEHKETFKEDEYVHYLHCTVDFSQYLNALKIYPLGYF